MMKIANTWPVSAAGTIKREKATMAILTALSIISTHIRITIAFRLAKAPYSPIENRIADSIK